MSQERLVRRAWRTLVVWKGQGSCSMRWPSFSPEPSLAGAIYLSWRCIVERPVSVNALHRALPPHTPEWIVILLNAGQGGADRASHQHA